MQSSTNLALHHLEPLQLRVRGDTLQHPPVARKPNLGKPAIALQQQQPDRNEIVPQRMRQESQQVKFELSLLSHQLSAVSPQQSPVNLCTPCGSSSFSAPSANSAVKERTLTLQHPLRKRPPRSPSKRHNQLPHHRLPLPHP